MKHSTRSKHKHKQKQSKSKRHCDNDGDNDDDDDLAQIIKGQVPLTHTRSESDAGGDSSIAVGDEILLLRPETETSKTSKRNRWIYGIGSFLLLSSLVGGVVSLVLALRERRATSTTSTTSSSSNSNLDLLGPDIVVNTQPPTSQPPTASPTVSPMPSSSPSGYPSSTPSATPTTSPSESPSESPTPSPSVAPSSTPTRFPTSFPTPQVLYFPQHPEPTDPPSSYFNYDPSSDYGPHRWNRVNTRNSWLREFTSNDGYGPWDGHLWREDAVSNQCGGPDRKQSPKNLVKTRNTECEATHEIRTSCATHPLSDDDAFEKQILPHKLSIKNRRRPCLNVNEDGTGRGNCDGPRPPMVDFPRYAASGSDYSDMHHMDLKIPGEHTLEGEAFDAEIQMLHMHLSAPRVAAIGIPVRARQGGYNKEFQWILNEFQAVFDDHKNKCALSKRRNLRQQQQQQHQQQPSLYPNANTTTSSSFWRELQDENLHRRHFNPYSDSIMPGMFFYRYDGSITEPPCKDVTWWVMDEPCTIGLEQLNQLKTLLFGHVGEDCTPTSVHNRDQSVVRPIQPLGEDREIQHCPDGSFRSDEDKGRNPGKRCRAD